MPDGQPGPWRPSPSSHANSTPHRRQRTRSCDHHGTERVTTMPAAAPRPATGEVPAAAAGAGDRASDANGRRPGDGRVDGDGAAPPRRPAAAATDGASDGVADRPATAASDGDGDAPAAGDVPPPPTPQATALASTRRAWRRPATCAASPAASGHSTRHTPHTWAEPAAAAAAAATRRAWERPRRWSLYGTAPFSWTAQREQ